MQTHKEGQRATNDRHTKKGHTMEKVVTERDTLGWVVLLRVTAKCDVTMINTIRQNKALE